MKQCSVCFFIVFIGLNFSFGHRSNTPTELEGQLLGSEQAVVLATSVGYHPEIIPKNYAQYPKEHVQPKPNKNHLMVVQSIAPPYYWDFNGGNKSDCAHRKPNKLKFCSATKQSKREFIELVSEVY